MADPFYGDPMGNVTMPPEEGFAPSPMYEKAMDAIAKAGAAVGSPVTRALQTAADVYSNKSREAASENEALRQQAMQNMAGDRAGMVPVGAGQMLLSQLGTATLPLTAAAKTIGHAATQATGNPRFGENVELLSGFVDPSHVGMLKATAPMVGAAAARQAVQVAREVTPVAQATRELSPLGFYSHGADTAANLAQAKGTPDQMTAMLRKYGVKPDELYNAGIADETATNFMRSKIEREYAPKLAAAKLEMDALGLNENTINKKSPDYNKALEIRQSPETKAKYQYDSTLNAMRSDMDSAMVLHPEWASRPSVTRDELTQHFNERRPQVEETVLGFNQNEVKAARERAESLGNNWDELGPVNQGRYIRFVSGRSLTDYGTDPKFSQYTLPGGENYREVLLKLPENKGGVKGPKGWDDTGGGTSDTANFRDPHWDDPNVIAHLRFSDRVGPNGEKILHVEEAQSGWGQKGRKEGFVTKYKPEDIKEIDPANITSERRRNEFWNFQTPTNAIDVPRNDRWPTMEAARQHILDNMKPTGIPTAPYVTNTAAWTDLAIKRALREAAEGGYDKLVWTPGAEQAKRYPEGGPKREEGMKGYYDKIWPNQLGKQVKKLDPSVKVGITDVMLPQGLHGMIGHNNPPFAAPGLDITPKMREAIMKGQTDFARGGSVKGYAEGGQAKGGAFPEPALRDEDTYGPPPDPNRAQGLSDKVNAALANSNVRRAARPPMEPTLLDALMGEKIPPGYYVDDGGQLRNERHEVVKREPRPTILPLTKDVDFTDSKFTDLIQYLFPGLGGAAAKGAGAAAKGAGAVNPASSLSRRKAIFPKEMLNPTIPPTGKRVPAPFPNEFGDIGKIGLQNIADRGRPPTPNVFTSPFADLARFEGEGGKTRDAIMAARRMSEEKRVAEEAFRARQLPTLDNEAPGVIDYYALGQAKKAELAAKDKTAYQAQKDAMINEGGGVRERYFPGTDFTMGGGSSSGVYRPDYTLPEGSRFGLPAVRGSTAPATIGGPALSGTGPATIGGPARSGTGLVPFGGPASASGAPVSAAAGGPDMAAFLRKLGIGVMGGGAVLAALKLANQENTGGGSPNTTTTVPNAAVPNAVVPNAAGTSLGSDPGTKLFDAQYIGPYIAGGGGGYATNPETGLFDGQYRGPSIAATTASGLRSRLQRPPDVSQPNAAVPNAAVPPAAGTERSLMERLFGGPEYQSNSRLVVDRPQGTENDKSPMTELNWGDNDRAADFVRADRAMQALQKGGEEFIGKNNTDYEGRASGGGVNRSSSKASGGRDAAIYKALEIIHHMMVNR